MFPLPLVTMPYVPRHSGSRRIWQRYREKWRVHMIVNRIVVALNTLHANFTARSSRALLCLEHFSCFSTHDEWLLFAHDILVGGLSRSLTGTWPGIITYPPHTIGVCPDSLLSSIAAMVAACGTHYSAACPSRTMCVLILLVESQYLTLIFLVLVPGTWSRSLQGRSPYRRLVRRVIFYEYYRR